MAKMRAVQVSRPGGPFEIVTRDVPVPGAGEVRMRVEACGICHSDSLTKEGAFPGIQYPRTPGHEVVGTVDSIGPGVVNRKIGDRIGAGWHGGYCGICDPCRHGDTFACVLGRIHGVTCDGGYAEFMIARSEGTALVPEGLSAIEAAPLMCAGITTYNALRNAGARSGDLVAVLGLGGLGHLAVQYAAKMGMRTVAIARGKDKAALAKTLGAVHAIDSKTSDPAVELQKLGGARVILATVTNGDAMTAVIGGLALNGSLVIVGVPEKLDAMPMALVMGRRSVKGWYSGTALDSEDTLRFSAHAGVRSMNEAYPLDRVTEAYDRMMSGDARFRVVLTMAR